MPHAEYAASDAAWRHYLGRQLAPAFYTILRNMFAELSGAGTAAAEVLVDSVLPSIDDWSVKQLKQLVTDVQHHVPKIARIYKEACTARAAMIASTQQATPGKLKFTCPKLDTFLHEAFATAADELSYEQAEMLGSSRRKDRRRLEQVIAVQISAVMADCIDLTTILRHADAQADAADAEADSTIDKHVSVPVEHAGGADIEVVDATREATREATPEPEPEPVAHSASASASASDDDTSESPPADATREATHEAASEAVEHDESSTQPSLESSEDSIEDEVSALIERVRQRGTQRVKRQVRLVK